MKKTLECSLVAFILVSSVFAGDVAVFHDIGFSQDGKTYIFGQYGKTDKKYQPYAELYTIDVEKNEYVPGQVYKSLENNSVKSGHQIYEDLYAKHCLDIKRYDCKSTNADDVLYICDDNSKKGTDLIKFQNYGDGDKENAFTYSVSLVPTYSGSGVNTKSSFYIDLKLTDNTGGVRATYKVGSPDIKRKGVTAYKIVRIFRDTKQKNLVFVVEKTVEDSTGTSIRYMVETIKL